MVQINSNSRYDGDDFQKNLFGFFCSIFISVSMIVTVLGIKFKWFKHRMNLEPINTQRDSALNQGTYRNSNSSSNATSKYTTYNQVHGVFRKRDDAEIAIERPESLPPIRIRNSTRKPLNLTPNERFSQPLPSVSHVQDEPQYQEITHVDNQYPRVHELIIPDTPVVDKNEVEARTCQDDENFAQIESTNLNETPQVKKRLFVKQEKSRTVHFDTRDNDIDSEDKKARRPTGLGTSTWGTSENDNEDNLSICDSSEPVQFRNNELEKHRNEADHLNEKTDEKLKQNFDPQNEKLNNLEYYSEHDVRYENDKEKSQKYSGTEIPDYFHFDQMQNELRVLSRQNQNSVNDEPKQFDGTFDGNETKIKTSQNSSNISEVYEEPIELIPISIEDLTELERRETKYQDELHSSGEIQHRTKHFNNEHLYEDDIDQLASFVSTNTEKIEELETNERFNFPTTMTSNTSTSQVSTITESSSYKYLEPQSGNEPEELSKYYEVLSNNDQFDRSFRSQSIDSLEGARKRQNERNVIKFETSSDDEESDDDKSSDFDKNQFYQEVPEFERPIQNVPRPEPRTTITKSMENLNTSPTKPKPSLRLSLENVNVKSTEGQMKEIEKDSFRRSFELEDVSDEKFVQKKILRIDE